MKIKLVFATATAVGLMMGTAWADSNISVIGQTGGSNNTASVDQSGTENVMKFIQNGSNNSVDAYQHGSYSNGGVTTPSGHQHLQYDIPGLDSLSDVSGYNYITQNGSNNSLTLKQTGKGTSIGIDGHVLQTGNRNEATITQKGGLSAGGSVNLIEQTDATGTATHATNKLTVLQQGGYDGYGDGVHYAYEYIYSVLQTNTGGALNELTLTQKGGNSNEIYHVVQNGTDNTGDVTQNGYRNFLASLSQTGSSNNASITLTGNDNGLKAAGHLGTVFSSTAASATGVTQATATQNGNRNALSYSASGNNNLFGFVQSGIVSGDDNDIAGTTVDNDNQVAVGQWGDNNNTTFSQSGNSNDLGVAIYGNNNGQGNFRTNSAAADVNLTNGDVTQSGGTNMASITIGGSSLASSDNDYAAKQTGGNNKLTLTLGGGNTNNVAVSQAGDDTAVIAITGSNNVLGARQLGSAGTNSLDVTINGSFNNWSTTMTGDAGDLGLKAGSIYQNNNDTNLNNDISLDIQSSYNLFAVRQVGSGNTVTGSVTSAGNYNQAAVLQVGSSNTASFLQNGAYNNVGISQ